MDKSAVHSINAIDKAIAELQKAKYQLLNSMPLFDKVVGNFEWVIKKSENKYYRVASKCTPLGVVQLSRNNCVTEFDSKLLNEQFRLAEDWEAKQHEAFLQSKQVRQEFKLQLPEFYMVTVRGIRGAKVRHETFEKAVEEATKFSQKENYRAHIMGVVAIIEPTQVQEPKTEYKLIKK